MGMWNLYRQANSFGESPSRIFGIRGNAWLAWQFDNAVLYFGIWAQNRIDAVDDKGRRKYTTLAAALGLHDGKPKKINLSALAGMPGVKFK